MHHTFELDARGLNITTCIVQLRRMLQRMYPGQLLRVIATDPFSEQYVASYCADTGNQLLESKLDGDRLFHTIKKQS